MAITPLIILFPHSAIAIADFLGFPAMEVGIETGKINKNKQKEKNLRNSNLGDEHAEKLEFPLPSHLACVK